MERGQDRGAAPELPHGARDLRRPEPRDRGELGLPRHGPLGPRAQHARVPRRHARVAAARAALRRREPAGRQPAGLLARAAVAQLRLRGRRLVAAGVHGPARPHHRPGRRAGDGGHARLLLLRAGPAPEGRAGRPAGGRRGHELAPRPGRHQRPRRGQQRMRHPLRPPDPPAGERPRVDLPRAGPSSGTAGGCSSARR